MEVTTVSSRSAGSAHLTPPPVTERPLQTADRWEAPKKAKAGPQAQSEPKHNWRGEMEGAWYVTKLMTLSAIGSAFSTLADGWDCLRSKFSREESN